LISILFCLKLLIALDQEQEEEKDCDKHRRVEISCIEACMHVKTSIEKETYTRHGERNEISVFSA
jgi:hypothetical protein